MRPQSWKCGLAGSRLDEWDQRISELLGDAPKSPFNELRYLIEQKRAVSHSLDDLRPEIRPMVDGFLADCRAAGLDVLVTCTARTLAEQAALYAQGRTTPGRKVTNAKPGQSAHNYGLAIDVVPLVNGKPDWEGDDPCWQVLGQIGQARGLQWFGAPDSPYKEEPHFQLPNWRALAGIG